MQLNYPAYTHKLALYSVILTSAFVACITNIGEDQKKLITCSNVQCTWMLCGHVEKWHIHGKTISRVSVRPITTTDHAQLSGRHQAVLVMFLGFRKLPHSCTATEEMCHSSLPCNLHPLIYEQSTSPISCIEDRRSSRPIRHQCPRMVMATPLLLCSSILKFSCSSNIKFLHEK